MNLLPAKCKGVSYSSPIFIPAYAVDQSKHAMIAQNTVFPLVFKN